MPRPQPHPRPHLCSPPLDFCRLLLQPLLFFIQPTPAEGARTTVHAVVGEPAGLRGQYLERGGLAKAHEAAANEALGREQWSRCEAMLQRWSGKQ